MDLHSLSEGLDVSLRVRRGHSSVGGVLAAAMVADLEPDPLGPVVALRIARGYAGLERDREAAQWFAFVIAAGDEDQARAAHRGLGLVFYRYDRLDRARRHLDQAADQLGVQVVLADIALRQGRIDDARALLTVLRRSRDAALAVEAACQLGTLESSTGHPDAAREAFTAALGAADPAVVARARTGLAALPPDAGTTPEADLTSGAPEVPVAHGEDRETGEGGEPGEEPGEVGEPGEGDVAGPEEVAAPFAGDDDDDGDDRDDDRDGDAEDGESVVTRVVPLAARVRG